MSDVDKAYETQLANIQKKTGKTMADLDAIVHNSGLSKHGEIRSMLMERLGLGYGDANTLTHFVLKSDGERAAQAQELSTVDVLNEIYSGQKTLLRPIHEKLMQAINAFGEFEIAPKKGYISLRRKKQFAMIGPKTNTRIEVGINHKSLTAHPRLVEQPAGSMCNFVVKVSSLEEVDNELIAWIEQAYENAG